MFKTMFWLFIGFICLAWLIAGIANGSEAALITAVAVPGWFFGRWLVSRMES